MPSLELIHLIYLAAAACGILLAEAVYLLFAGRRARRDAVNRRLRLREGQLTQEQVLVQLRKERGIVPGGSARFAGMLRRLRIQSGLTMSLPRFLLLTSAAAGRRPRRAFPGHAAAVRRRASSAAGRGTAGARAAFHAQAPSQDIRHPAPEALELITRGLKAGHPVPVAIAMVAREMPDPIGTEFGLVADEVTYGSDLVSALNAMYERVGHEDLPLFVTAVSIQSTSGGNLREILDGLSTLIRERGKLRRKVRSISTEGRMSAYILTAIPAFLMSGMMVLMPQFYSNVWEEPLTWYLLGGSVAWLMLGNAIMFKMSNFRF
jgi:tight adherence protein B